MALLRRRRLKKQISPALRAGLTEQSGTRNKRELRTKDSGEGFRGMRVHHGHQDDDELRAKRAAYVSMRGDDGIKDHAFDSRSQERR